MKVIQVISTISLNSSGPSYSVPALCRGLESNGVSVELHTREPLPPRKFPFPVKTYPSPSWLGLIEGAPRMTAGLVAAGHDAEIVHNNGLWSMPNVYSAVAIRRLRANLTAEVRKPPLLVTSPRGTLAGWALKHSAWKKRFFGWFFGQYAALRATDMWHATCEKEYREIRAAGYKQPVAIVPIGLDLPGVEAAKVAAGGDTGQRLKKAVFFGRIHEVKGCDKLVRAWGRLTAGGNSSADGWELVIAGPDCGALPEVKRIVTESKIPRVSFVGELNGQAKYDFLAAADLYVLPTETENFGITIAEALGCGVPVITTKGAPWSGIVDHQCGWWIDNNVDALESAMREAMALPNDQLWRMGAAGREWIRSDFAWEGIGAKMKAAYEWLVDPILVERPEWVRVD